MKKSSSPVFNLELCCYCIFTLDPYHFSWCCSQPHTEFREYLAALSLKDALVVAQKQEQQKGAIQ